MISLFRGNFGLLSSAVTIETGGFGDGLNLFYNMSYEPLVVQCYERDVFEYCGSTNKLLKDG